MKRLFVAAIIFLFIVTICFAGNYALLKKLNGFKSRIEECRRLYNAGEIESAQKCVEAFKEDWYKTSKTVSAFANHRAIDEIGVLVSALPEAARAKNDFEFASIINRIETEVNLIYKEQSFDLENFY